MIQEGQSGQRRKFYRSIQYRSVSIDINPQKLDVNSQRLPVFSSSKPKTSKAEYRSSKKNLFSSVQQMKSFNKTQSQSLNKTKQMNLTSTVISSGSPEQESATNFGNCSYLESFSQLMKTQSKRTNETKKMRAVSLRLSGLKPADLPDRITLPNIIEYDNSQFTALDPINLPINAIKDHIKRTKKQMEQCPDQLQSIKWEIQDFKTKNISNMQSFKLQFMKGVDRLWGMLRQNSVHQQSFSLRVKRQIKELQHFVPAIKKEFEKSHQNQLQLQTTIFSTSPFELKKNQQADDGLTLKSKSLIKAENNYF